MSNLKKAIIKGTIWSVFGQMASLLIILVTNIWLARLLSPKEFGQVGVIMFFITLANVFTESGLGGALIRKKNATSKDYSTVFVTNLAFSLICFFLIYISAEFIADYYEDSLLNNLLIVSSLVLVVNAFQLTQNAKMISEMRFKQGVIYKFISVSISSAIGIYFAYQGLGVWALVLIQLLTAIINTTLLWVYESFFLKFYFSRSSFKELYSFGINTTLASLLNTGFDNLYQLVLAKYFSLSQAGYFYQAKRLQDVPGGIIKMITNNVIFSSLTKLQDDKSAFIRAYNNVTLYFLVLLGFTSVSLYIYAEVIILLFYGKEWIEAAYYIQLLTIASFFYMQENVNRVIFKIFNQTQKILYLEYVKKTIQLFSIFIGVYYLELKILLVGFVLTNIISYFINYYYSRKIIGKVKSSELLTLLKVCLVSFLSLAFSAFLFRATGLTGYYTFFGFPLLLLLYGAGIHFFKIMNIRKNISMIFKYITN